eukprot:TRINITY_DN3249_c0_g3_i1.p1 TRINITY_DN3249_c0_g3~~TRINITY_DN3249_c0_g3_i1.p1  ORF type:complete len:1410 (-),score=231.12 TRINITY_DN3249_c0_g3_i1:217-4335(-)
MVALREQIAQLRQELQDELPKLADSAHKWRYMSSTLGKLRHLNDHFASDLSDEMYQHQALEYHIAEQDAFDLHEASDGLGTDEEKMGKVIFGRLRENINLTDKIYQVKYGKSLYELVKCENKTLLGMLGADSLSHFGRFLTYRTMSPAKRDALLFRRAMSGMGCSDKILIEVISTRTNAELRAAAEVYAAEFEGESLVERIKSETGGFGAQWYGKWIDTLCDFDRDEGQEVPDNVEALAQQLYDAGKGKWMGCDEQVFIDVLAKANENTLRAICAAYENLECTSSSLCEDIADKMGGDLEYAVLARVRPHMEFFALRLFKACSGWGTDEECVCRVLGCLDNDQVVELAEMYNATFADKAEPLNDFRTLIATELSGALLDGMLHMLDSTPPKSHWRAKHNYQVQAQKEADSFRAHVEENHEEEKMMLFGGKDSVNGPLQLVNVEQHFICEGYDYTLYSDHSRHENPDMAYLLEQDPADETAARQLISDLQAAVGNTKGEAEKNVCALEGARAKYYDLSRDMRFKDHNLNQHKIDNEAMLEFCADRDADAVHQAIEGWGTDEDRLITILCSLSKRQLRRVDTIYAEKFGQSLREVCDGELSGFFEGNFKYFMKCAMTPPAELDAELLVDSMKGLGTDDTLLCEIVCTRSNHELELAKAIFQEREGKSVDEWVEGDTSGFYTTFLLRCLKADRAEGFCSQQLAERQVEQLHAAGLGGGDVTEAPFLQILPTASEQQITMMREVYKEKYGIEMVEAITNMGGEMERALKARVQDRLTYYANVLNNAWSGIGTDEKATARVLGRNTKADVRRIGTRYEDLFGGSLRQRIKGETSGNFQKALLTYIFAEGPGNADEANIMEAEMNIALGAQVAEPVVRPTPQGGNSPAPAVGYGGGQVEPAPSGGDLPAPHGGGGGGAGGGDGPAPAIFPSPAEPSGTEEPAPQAGNDPAPVYGGGFGGMFGGGTFGSGGMGGNDPAPVYGTGMSVGGFGGMFGGGTFGSGGMGGGMGGIAVGGSYGNVMGGMGNAMGGMGNFNMNEGMWEGERMYRLVTMVDGQRWQLCGNPVEKTVCAQPVGTCPNQYWHIFKDGEGYRIKCTLDETSACLDLTNPEKRVCLDEQQDVSGQFWHFKPEYDDGELIGYKLHAEWTGPEAILSWTFDGVCLAEVEGPGQIWRPIDKFGKQWLLPGMEDDSSSSSASSDEDNKRCPCCKGRGYFDVWSKPCKEDSMHKDMDCPLCNGEGVVEVEVKKCRSCNGKGGVNIWDKPCFKNNMHFDHSCSQCDGRCYISKEGDSSNEGEHPCPCCKGRGYFDVWGRPCKEDSMHKDIDCAVCSGAGLVEGKLRKCRACHGKGGISIWNKPCLKNDMHFDHECSQCEGKCYIPK